MIDPTQIQTALGLVAAATGATGSAVGVIQQIKNLVGGSKTSPELDSLVNDLSNKLTAANVLNLQLSESLRTLSGQLARDNEFAEQKSRYDLFQTSMGDFVWRYARKVTNTEPDHFACPVCMGDGRVSYISGNGHYRMCQKCGKGFDFERAPPMRNY